MLVYVYACLFMRMGTSVQVRRKLTFIFHFVCNRVSCLHAQAGPLWSSSFCGFSSHSTGVLGSCQGWASPPQFPLLAQPVCHPLSLSLILHKLFKVKTVSDRKVSKLIFSSSIMIFFTLNVMSFIHKTIKLTAM